MPMEEITFGFCPLGCEDIYRDNRVLTSVDIYRLGTQSLGVQLSGSGFTRVLPPARTTALCEGSPGQP